MMDFVHLRCTTEYSLVEGILWMDKALAMAERYGQPALAMTDIGNISGAIKFFKSALSPSGARQKSIQPILGAQLFVRSQLWPERTRTLFLVQTVEGYINLCALISQSFADVTSAEQAVINVDSLTPEQLRGLYALSGHADGDVGNLLLAGLYDKAKELCHRWHTLMEGRYALELQWAERLGEQAINEGCLAIGHECHIPLVATHPIMFAQPEDFEAHEVRVCIARDDIVTNPDRVRNFTPRQYYLSTEEMNTLFADTPQALANSVLIAQSCSFLFDFLVNKTTTYHLPSFPTPNGEGATDYLKSFAHAQLEERLIKRFPEEMVRQERTKDYRARLDFELATILKMGFAGYYLIVAEFIDWAKAQSIPVGPGRGSGAGSLVAYLLGITGIDPLAHGLLFERFLNPDRQSMPDFDIDFCEERRGEVIEHVRELYGNACVAQIITFMTMGARGAIRDCARALGLSVGAAGSLADLIPAALDMTLDKAMAAEPQITRKLKEEPALAEVWAMAKQLEGLPRNVGVHAAGILITPKPLANYCPLYRADAQSRPAAQFDMKDIELLGLVKFDFLGLSTLTVINRAVQEVRRLNPTDHFDINLIPEYDEGAYHIFQSGDTNAIFQSESRTAKELERRIHPDNFEELTALMALNRPGPLGSGMVEDYIDVKHGKKSIFVPDERLREILAPTYGVIIYQEQVMQIAQKLANYSLGSADMLRRAMGKKDATLMAQNRDKFIQGAIDNQADPQVAKDLFELIEKFAEYGFNKSHSAAYAVIAYQTAYLKAHYPSAFMASVMTNEIGNNGKISAYIIDCRALKIEVLPPSINHSDFSFLAQDKHTISFGLGAIKGVGRAAVEVIIKERHAHGAFRDCADFMARLDKTLVNKKALEALIKAGALDELGGAHRHRYLQMIEGQGQEQGAPGGLFDTEEAATPSSETAGFISKRQNLAWEHEVLDFYLSGHLMDFYQDDLRALRIPKVSELAKMEAGQERATWVGGLITSTRVRKTAKGLMMSAVMDDASGTLLDVAVFSKILEQSRSDLLEGRVVLIYGRVAIDSLAEEKTSQKIIDDDGPLAEKSADKPERHEKYAGMPRMRVEKVMSYAQALHLAFAMQWPLHSVAEAQSMGAFLNQPNTALPSANKIEMDIYADWRIEAPAKENLPSFEVRLTAKINAKYMIGLDEETLLSLREQWHHNETSSGTAPHNASWPTLSFRPLPTPMVKKRWDKPPA